MRKDRLTALLETAEKHTQAGRHRRALDFYRKALTIARAGEWEWELAQVRIADLHLIRGEGQSALIHLLKAREQDPDEPRYAVLVGRALRLLGQPKKASHHLMNACDSGHAQVPALIELAFAAVEMGQRSAARDILDVASRLAPQHPGILVARSHSLDS
tara:strand:- start:5616 stop:6092 length:477 start_codon:yes stop_codon:yes gene_type:complete